MGSSFVEYKDKGVWFRDALVAMALDFVVNEIKKTEQPEWMQDYSLRLLYASQGLFPGFTTLEFDEYLNIPEKRDYFIGILDKTIDELRKKGEFISADE